MQCKQNFIFDVRCKKWQYRRGLFCFHSKYDIVNKPFLQADALPYPILCGNVLYFSPWDPFLWARNDWESDWWSDRQITYRQNAFGFLSHNWKRFSVWFKCKIVFTAFDCLERNCRKYLHRCTTRFYWRIRIVSARKKLLLCCNGHITLCHEEIYNKCER